MARRRGNASDAGGLFIIGAMFVFMILGALLPAIVSFVAYAGPPFLAYQWLMARRRIAKVPTLPDPDVFQWQPMRLRLAALCFPRHRASDLLGEIHRRGEASGIALTKASDERRFDVRKKLGRELNDELDAAETALASANERFEREFVAARLSLPDWQGAFSECASARSALVASGAAIVAYAMTFPCLLWLELPLVQSLSTQAAWVIEPLRVVYGPAACATLVGAVVLATARMLSEHHFAEHLLVEYRAAWWGGTLRQTSVTQRLTTASNCCGKVGTPALAACSSTSSARPRSSAECITKDASSIPVCGIEPASASTHTTFDQAVTNRSRNARRPWS